MLTVTDNTTQQINAALFEQDQNVKNKLSTVSGVVSAVYGACEWIFNKLKESLARVATTGSYNDLTDKPTIVDTVAQNVPNAVSSNAVYGVITEFVKEIAFTSSAINGYHHDYISFGKEYSKKPIIQVDILGEDLLNTENVKEYWKGNIETTISNISKNGFCFSYITRDTHQFNYLFTIIGY